MEKIILEKYNPIELINKKYKYETKYQRDKAWNKNISSALIDSIINSYYIPPILVANNEVVDGKQRLLAIEGFVNNEFVWKNSSNIDSEKNTIKT